MNEHRTHSTEQVQERALLEKAQRILDLEPEALRDLAERCAKRFKPINITQIRNFYSQVTRLRQRAEGLAELGEHRPTFRDLKAEFAMLRPRLAYVAARHAKTKQRNRSQPILLFQGVFDRAIAAVMRSADPEAPAKDALRSFFDFAEAVVAYHRFYQTADEQERREVG